MAVTIERKLISEAAAAVARAWSIVHGGADGPREDAHKLLDWLKSFRVEPSTELYGSLQLAAAAGEKPSCVSKSDRATIMTWYARDGFAFARDLNGELFFFPEADLRETRHLFSGLVGEELSRGRSDKETSTR